MMFNDAGSGPCKDCKEREVGCHGYCELYINWRKKYDEFKKEHDKERLANYYSKHDKPIKIKGKRYK